MQYFINQTIELQSTRKSTTAASIKFGLIYNREKPKIFIAVFTGGYGFPGNWASSINKDNWYEVSTWTKNRQERRQPVSKIERSIYYHLVNIIYLKNISKQTFSSEPFCEACQSKPLCGIHVNMFFETYIFVINLENKTSLIKTIVVSRAQPNLTQTTKYWHGRSSKIKLCG